jgi:hypothetical protein
MTLDHHELGRWLLVTAASLLACTPTPEEVETTPNVTTAGDTTVGMVSSTATMGTADDTGPSFDPICGDGIVESPEECDLGDLNGGGMYCTSECTNNICGDGYVGPGEGCDDGNQSNEDLCTTECGPASCGDGVVQAGEACDEGEDNSETGACLPSCVAASCGDQFIQEAVESCDSNNIGDQTCELAGFSGGVLLCAADCLQFDTSNCFACGDGSINRGEQCDGAQLDGETCMSQGFDDGTLACSGSCTFDAAGCISFACGNGVIDGADECDGADLGGQTCMGLNFDGGDLMCSGGCTFDTAACYECGDGSIDPGEDCDGAQLGGATCQQFALPGDTASGGMPSCNASCMLTDGTCTFCGDNVREGTETCDGPQLGGQSCITQGFDGGSLACNATCNGYNTSGCTECGDGVQEGTEECDGADLDGGTCSSPLAAGPGHGGTLSCAGDCTYDITQCCLNGGQPCMGNDMLCCDGTCNASGGTQC